MNLRGVAWPATVLVALVLQSTVVERISVMTVHPDLVLLLTVYAALTRGPVAAMALGFSAGMVADGLSGGMVGAGAWSKATAGMIVGTFRNSVFRERLVTHLIAVTAGTLLSEGGSFLLASMFGHGERSFARFAAVTVGGCVFNMAVSPAVFWALLFFLPPQRTPEAVTLQMRG